MKFAAQEKSCKFWFGIRQICSTCRYESLWGLVVRIMLLNALGPKKISIALCTMYYTLSGVSLQEVKLSKENNYIITVIPRYLFVNAIIVKRYITHVYSPAKRRIEFLSLARIIASSLALCKELNTSTAFNTLGFKKLRSLEYWFQGNFMWSTPLWISSFE